MIFSRTQTPPKAYSPHIGDHVCTRISPGDRGSFLAYVLDVDETSGLDLPDT